MNIGLVIELALLVALSIVMIRKRETISELVWHLARRNVTAAWLLRIGLAALFVLTYLHFFFGLWQ